MGIDFNTDIVHLFETLTERLQTTANSQHITLTLDSDPLPSSQFLFDPLALYSQFYTLLNRIMSFTPGNENIMVSLISDQEKPDAVTVTIKNSGINLYRMREIFNDLSLNTTVQGTPEGGTLYNIKLNFDTLSISTSQDVDYNNLGYKPYYQEIENKLSAYFKEIDNLQASIDKRDEKQGAFLRKANKIIQLRMNDNAFKVDALAAAMALSRAQLFRKIKALTKMSPSEYLLYFRLHIARDLLKAEKNGFNVSEAGYHVGFVSKSHFSRSFQKQFGVSPSTFKNMQQSGNKSQP